jgi:RHS repeat-associated protein
MDATGSVTQKYITLPGDIIATIQPGSTSAGATTYSLPNIHGDIFATINADGALLDTFTTGPFGETLPVQPATPAGALAPSVQPNNTAAGTSWNYVGQHEKMTDIESSSILGGVTQMGARVYISQLGRFIQVDPVEGGTDNNYAYANDPVNEFDLGGTVVETAADIASIGYDSYQLYKKPSWGNAGMLTWSVAATLIPFVPGSYVGRAGATAFKAAKGAAPVMAKKMVAKTAPKVPSGLRQKIANGNNVVRIGRQTPTSPFRVSIGPAPGHYKDLSKLRKVLSPIHIHMEKAKGGLDVNWLKVSSGKGVKSIKLWGNWKSRW